MELVLVVVIQYFHQLHQQVVVKVIHLVDLVVEVLEMVDQVYLQAIQNLVTYLLWTHLKVIIVVQVGNKM